MQIVHKIEDSILLNIVLKDTNLSSQEQKLQILIKGNRFDVINKNVKLKQIALEGILSGKISAIFRRRSHESNLQSLSMLLRPFIVDTILYGTENNNGRSFIDYIHSTFRFYDFTDEKYEDTLNTVTSSNDGVDNLIKKLYENIDDSLNSNLSDWKNSLEKWDFLIENLRNVFGDKWSFKMLSTIIAGIKNTDSIKFVLSDSSISLCKRAKYVYTKRDNINHWEQQFNQKADLMFVCLMFFTWATPKILIGMFDTVLSILSQFPENEIRLLSNSLRGVIRRNELRKSQAKEIVDFLQSKSSPFEIKYLISYRLPSEIQKEFICSQNNDISEVFKVDIIKTKFESLINKYLKNAYNEKLLANIKEYYTLFSNCDINDEYIYHRYLDTFESNNHSIIPIDIARGIMEESKSYPRAVTSIAEKSCRLYANEHLKIVGQIANDEKWFD
jgi:hypothetical protein